MDIPLRTEPRIVSRTEQPYVSIAGQVTTDTFAEIADRMPELFGWLGAHRVAPAGTPFFRYAVVDMERRLEVEAGVPVAEPVAGDGDVRSGMLPAGRYATVTHVGHPAELVGVTAALLDWAAQRGLAWDMTPGPEGERWGCRLEVLKTNPAEEPDMNKWETELVFRLSPASGRSSGG